MTKRNILATCVAAALSSGAFSASALAQDGDQEPTAIFEEVVVTAQRRAQSIYQVPVAISAFTNEALKKQGITGLVDIGKFVPNLNVTSFGGGHTSSARGGKSGRTPTSRRHPRSRGPGSADSRGCSPRNRSYLSSANRCRLPLLSSVVFSP